MKRIADDEYLEKAKRLSKDEAERLFSRMGEKLTHRLKSKIVSPLEAVAIQLEKEEEQLAEWRERWAEISAGERKKKEKEKNT